MERKIIRDIIFLKQKSKPAAASDTSTGDDLYDTLTANRERCVGLAANMIGVNKRIIIVQTPLAPIVMYNPTIISHSNESFEAEEGCLSLDGVRKTKRWERIEVEYQDREMKKRKGKFSGFTAQIIQHEIDHCNGIII